jgi:putative DNA primase/helicase
VLDFARFAPNRSRKSSLWPNIELSTLSRMADLDRWGEAVMRGLGEPPGTFIAAYRANRRAACADVLEQSPVAAALVTMLAR